MLKDKLMEQLRNDNHYTIPKYVITNLKKLNLDLNSFILLVYLLNVKNKDIFNYKEIMNELNFTEKEVFDSISALKDKKLLSIEMIKNENGVLEERLNIDSFYEISFSMILNDQAELKKDDTHIYDTFEKEFGRTLSPIEYEIINGWIESKINEELILAALKEAVFNGVNNLRYIDKILYEWGRKGIKSAKDIDKKRKQKQDDEKSEETYEYDWLNE